MSYSFKDVFSKVKAEAIAFHYHDSVVNEGKRTAYKWLKEYTDQIDELLKIAYDQDIKWKLLDIQQSKVLAILQHTHEHYGLDAVELWRIDIEDEPQLPGRKLGVYYYDRPPGGVCFLTRENLRDIADDYVEKTKQIKEALDTIDLCPKIYKAQMG